MNDSVAFKNSNSTQAALRESFVLVAMTVVAVAVGVGFYAQFEAGFLLALLATSIGYVVLLAMHVLVRRAQQVVDLESEIARLSALNADMQRRDAAREREAKLAELEPSAPRARAPRPPVRPQAPSAGAVKEAANAFHVLPPPPPAISIAGYPRFSTVDAAVPEAGMTRGLEPSPASVDQSASTTPSDDLTADLDADAEKISAADPKAAGPTLRADPLQGVAAPLDEVAAPVTPKLESDASSGAKAGETREFENMHEIIQQLAAKLNAPTRAAETDDANGTTAPLSGDDETPPAASSETERDHVAAVTDQAIEQSAALLRSAAGDLRRMDASARAFEVAEAARGPTMVAPSAVAPTLVAEPHRPPTPDSRFALIAEAVAADRIDVYLDPILGLDERIAKHFEVSVRLRTHDQQELDAGDYGPIASQHGLLPQIEAAKLARTVKVAERLAARGGMGALFASFDGGSLGDDGFRKTYTGLFEAGASPDGRLVLAFAQSDVRSFTRAHWDEVATMSALGLRFSLEAVTDLDMDFEQLVGIGFGFIKLDAKVFLEGLPTSSGAVPAGDLCRHLSGLGLALVVGRIEDEGELTQVVGFGAVLGQGALFGAPRSVRVDMTPAQVAA